jgi:hypothetical protein
VTLEVASLKTQNLFLKPWNLVYLQQAVTELEWCNTNIPLCNNWKIILPTSGFMT